MANMTSARAPETLFGCTYHGSASGGGSNQPDEVDEQFKPC